MTTAVERQRDVPVPDRFRMAKYLTFLGAGLAGPANFTMQLAWPAVGHGVTNSRVHDGSAMLHPIKRSRTTFTYIAVALLGNDDDRTAYRQAVNRQHAQVVSGPEEPVAYRAMDPRLQTWVAACLYYGTIDVVEKLHGPLDDATADALYAHCARFGTTLQMPAGAWPVDRIAFEAYWQAGLDEVRIDPPVREHLMKLIRLENMPRPFRVMSASNVFITTGFLPPEFREAMSLPWSDRDQQRFDRRLRSWGTLDRITPAFLRSLPFRMLLWDMRARRRLGLRLV